jgi:hypothetical protein
LEAKSKVEEILDIPQKEKEPFGQTERLFSYSLFTAGVSTG